MTSILTLNLSDTDIPAQSTLIVGNTQTLYMSTHRLYLIGNQWVNDTSTVCSINADCIWNGGSSYTQVTSLDPRSSNPSPVTTRVM